MRTATFILRIPGLDLTSNPAREGLPYWIFWLLVSIILLLAFFVFLRNKDFRLRLSTSLAGTKRRMLRLRLQAKVKRERAKKSALWRELGRAAWGEDLRVKGAEEILGTLEGLESEMAAAHAEWHEAYRKIESLEKDLPAGDPAAAASLADWDGKKVTLQDRIIGIKKSEEPLYESLGRILDQSRPDLESLALVYFELDRAEQKIRALLARIEDLR